MSRDQLLALAAAAAAAAAVWCLVLVLREPAPEPDPAAGDVWAVLADARAIIEQAAP